MILLVVFVILPLVSPSSCKEDDCGVCDGPGKVCGECGGALNAAGCCGEEAKVCGECGGTLNADGCCGAEEKDCAESCGGDAKVVCGECGGALNAAGCCGIETVVCGECGGALNANGCCGEEKKVCGECGGSLNADGCCGAEEKDCAGVCGGDAKVVCGECGGSLNENGCCGTASKDCTGKCGGTAEEDCAGECGGTKKMVCGECGGTSCAPNKCNVQACICETNDDSYTAPYNIIGYMLNNKIDSVQMATASTSDPAGDENELTHANALAFKGKTCNSEFSGVHCPTQWTMKGDDPDDDPHTAYTNPAVGKKNHKPEFAVGASISAGWPSGEQICAEWTD